MWTFLLFWILSWMVRPLTWYSTWRKPFADSGYMDEYEPVYVLLTLPVLLLAATAYLYLAINRSRWNSRTLPLGKVLPRIARTLIIPGNAYIPSVTVGELFWVIVCVAFVLWGNWRKDWGRFKRIDSDPEKSLKGDDHASQLWQVKAHYAIETIGWMAFVVVIPLFFPVTRGSVLLRAAGIPFEQAIRYHRWVAQFVLWMTLAHGGGYFVLWIQEGVFWEEFSKWQNYKINNIAGELCMLVGIIVWLTALSPVRRSRYNFFILMHQLVFLWVLLLAMHLGPMVIAYLFPSILLYALDRTLRFIQSRHTVKAKRATIHPDSSITLVIPKCADVEYKPLSCVSICIPAISRLQWHPFSIASSPLDGRQELSLLIKPSGAWTTALHKLVQQEEPLALRLEGPYGQEQNFFTKYDSLLLVAGGSGVSPFLSLLKDLMHRCRSREQRLPANVTLVYAVRSAGSLKVLEDVCAAKTCPDYDTQVNLRVQLYVTGGREDAGTELTAADAEAPFLESQTMQWESDNGIVPRAFAGNDYLSLLMFLFVTGGTIAFMVVIVRFVVNSDKPKDATHVMRWLVGTAHVLAFAGGVFLTTAISAAVFYLLRMRFLCASAEVMGRDSPQKGSSNLLVHSSSGKDKNRGFLHSPSIVYGSRPQLASIFAEISQTWTTPNIGVLACGPSGLVDDVGMQCAKQSAGFLSFQKRPTFNFHSLGFTL